MGCGHSKLPYLRPEDSAPVALCRDRSALMAEAIRRRYALADAHRAYTASLQATGVTLHDFLCAVQDAVPLPPPALDNQEAAEHDAERVDDHDDGGYIHSPPAEEGDSSDEGHIHFPTYEEGDNSYEGFIQFLSDEEGDNFDEGHVQFSSDEETDPPVPQPDLPLPQPDPPLTQPDPPLPEPEEEEPLQPAAPAPSPLMQMAAPHGYPPPPYTYGPGPSYGYAYGTEMGSYGHGFVSSINYATSQPPSPSMTYTYEHRPQVGNAAVHYYQGDSAFGPPPPGSNYYGGYPYYQSPQGESISPAAPSPRRPASPVTPPSPPKVDTWDFLNPFETLESYYPEQLDPMANHTPSSSSNAPSDMPELEDEEGMPRLEDEEGMPELENEEDMPELKVEEDKPERVDEKEPEQEDERDMLEREKELGDVAGEADGGVEHTVENAKLVKEELGDVVGEGHDDVEHTVDNANLAKEEERSSSSSDELHPKSVFLDAGNISVGDESSQSLDAGSTISSTVHVLDKSLVEVEQQMEDSAVAEPPAELVKLYNDDVQVVQEIKEQFDRASKSAGKLCKMLEVGKIPYNHNFSGLKVPSMMICGLPSMGKEILQFEEEKSTECGNISCTLQKMYMWEKKLLEEVKAEEKIRFMYDKKYEEVKFLYNSGAEAHKLEAVQIYTRKLLTKISVAIQAVNSISDKINKLRDEELWPQTHELIQGFMQMWHTMSECYQIQCHAMSQAKDIDSSIAAATFSEAHVDLVKQLELQLLDMTANFAVWFSAQKSYVNTLNEWLKKGIEYVPEVTDDGVPPFSPGRLGAPPVFTIFNNWATSISRISEMEVVDTMQAFASNILGLWERHMSEWRQRMLADKDMGRDLRLMKIDELSMRKALQAQNKKLVRVSSQRRGVSLSAQMLHDSVPPSVAGLQSCMHKSFEAMESFAAACTNAMKDLHIRSQEEVARLAQENGAVS